VGNATVINSSITGIVPTAYAGPPSLSTDIATNIPQYLVSALAW